MKNKREQINKNSEFANKFEKNTENQNQIIEKLEKLENLLGKNSTIEEIKNEVKAGNLNIDDLFEKHKSNLPVIDEHITKKLQKTNFKIKDNSDRMAKEQDQRVWVSTLEQISEDFEDIGRPLL